VGGALQAGVEGVPRHAPPAVLAPRAAPCGASCDRPGPLEFRADELAVLHRLCVAVDELAELDQAVRAAPLFVEGGHGSLHLHPGRVARMQAARLVSDLVHRLDLDAAEAEDRPAVPLHGPRRSHRPAAVASGP
jgi:hypothetical protein